MNLGDRVLMTGNHSWAGEVGTYLGLEFIPGFGERPKIKLDNGTSCFAMRPGQVKVIEAAKNKKTGVIATKKSAKVKFTFDEGSPTFLENMTEEGPYSSNPANVPDKRLHQRSPLSVAALQSKQSNKPWRGARPLK